MATAILPDWELAQYPWLKPAAVLLKSYTFDALVATVKNVLSSFTCARDEATLSKRLPRLSV
jgi:hypothetical protein